MDGASGNVSRAFSLIALWEGGIADIEQVAAVYRACAGELWRALLVTAGGRVELADDATAEAFTRLLASKNEVREPRAWLYRTGFRIVVEELKRERRPAAAASPPPPPAGDSVFTSQLAGVLGTLSPEQRLAIFLRYHADLSIGEVANLTGASVPAVRVRLHRARKALRAVLEDTHV
jgi:RNA polymerase sigma-70 factor (ECF subfamily)